METIAGRRIRKSKVSIERIGNVDAHDAANGQVTFSEAEHHLDIVPRRSACEQIVDLARGRNVHVRRMTDEW